MKAADLVEGAQYAYRRAAGRLGYPIERVRLLSGRPDSGGRVRVRFESGDRAGSDGDATLGQLISAWSDMEALRADEAAYIALAATAYDAAEFDAAVLVCRLTVDDGLEVVPGGLRLHAGAIDAFAARGVAVPSTLLRAPGFTTRDGDLVVAATTVVQLAKAVVAADPLDALESVDALTSEGLGHHFGPVLALIETWTGVARTQAKTMQEQARREHEMRRALIEIRAEVQALASVAGRLVQGIDDLLGLEFGDGDVGDVGDTS